MKNPFQQVASFRRFNRMVCAAAGILLCIGSARAQQIVWSGAGTNSVPGNTNWSNAVNWSGALPSATTSVFFWDPGASSLGVSNINNIVDTSTTIYLLKYGNTNNSHTTLINPGVTLTVTNSTATNIVWVGTGTDGGLSQVTDATITGKTGTLSVSDTNTSSAMQVQQGSSSTGTHEAILDLSGLGTFNLTAGRLLVAGSPASGVNASNYLAGMLTLANTNMVQLNGATSPQLLVGDAISNPNNLVNYLQLGQTNSIFADNITIGRGKQNGVLRFNPSLAGNNPTLYLRGKSATQVSTLAIGDNGAQTGTSSSSIGTVDLSLGKVDAQVNSCIMARGQLAATSTGGATAILNVNSGVFNANTISAGVVTTNNAVYTLNATINVNGTATLVINNNLALGTNPNTNTANPSCVCKSTLNVTNGAVYANSITTASTNGVIGTINVNNGSLTISNTAGTAVARLASVNCTAAALHLLGNQTVTNIITTNLTGTATIYMDSIGYGGGTVTYPLISYLGTDPIAGLTASLGAYTGTLVDNTGAKRIDLQITAGPVTPLLGTVIWGGGINNNWETNSLNWTNSGVATTYADSDQVIFNDLGRTGGINLTSTVAPGSVTISNAALAYTISGPGNISGATSLIKAGTGTFTLSTTNTYTGNTFVNGGLFNVAFSNALPPTSIINLTGASNATVNIEGWQQTWANLITTNNAQVGATSIITGTLSSSLNVSPATLTLSPFHVTNFMNLNMSGLGAFNYNNSAGTMEVRVGVTSPSGVNAPGGVQTAVTLSANSNSITAASLKMGNNSPAGGTPIAQLNLGTNNIWNVGTVSLGSGRGGDTVQFASGITGGNLTINGATGPGSQANINFSGHDSFQASDSPVDTFDVTAGTLNAQISTITIGQDAPTPNMTANRGINGSSSFKMGAGTLTASSMTLGVILAAAGDNGSFFYTLTNTSLFLMTNGAVATITNLTLANNNYTGNFNPTLSPKLTAVVNLTGGSTLYSANIQEGSIAGPSEGTLTVIPELLWGNGTLCNIPGGGLTINGADVVLAGAAMVNIASGQTGLFNSWISGAGSLTDVGAGSLTLAGQNSFNGALIMASTNSLTLNNANTYTGNTVISNGTLFLTGSGSINSPNIIVESNATFDVSGLAPFTLGANTNQSLSGFGSVNGSVTVNSGSQIVPGGLGVPGKLTFTNDVTLNATTTYFDLSSSPSGNNDLVNIQGNLNLNGNATIWINMLNGTLAPGTYTLMTYSSLQQNGYNFVLVGPRGMTLNAGANALTLVVTTVSSANLTWVGDSSQNNWDVQTTTNWLNSGTLDYFYQLDNVTFNDTGSASPAINLTTALVPSSVTVNASQNYTFTSFNNGQLVGAMNLLKKGAGTLFLQMSNAYTGFTTVSNGTLELDTPGASGSGAINLNSTLNVNIGGNTLANTVNGPGTINVIASPFLDTVLGGSLSGFTGTIVVPGDPSNPPDTAEVDIISTGVNISANATIYATNGATFVAAGSGVIIAATNDISGTGNGNLLGALRVDTNAVISGPVNLLGDAEIGEATSGSISGVIADGGHHYSLTAVGSGANTLFLLATNTYTGGTIISNGILSLGNGVVNGTLPATTVPVTNYATLQYNVPTNVTVTPTAQILGTGSLSKLSDGVLWLTLSNSFSGGVTTGNGTGNGTSGGIIYLTNPYGFGNGISTDLMSTVSVQRTEVRLQGGITVASNLYFQTSGSAAVTTAGSGYAVFRNLSGTNIIPNNLELVTGAGNSEYASDGGLLVFNGNIFLSTASGRTAIFSGTGAGLVNGAITNGTTSLTVQKTGTGTWTFAGANLYYGTTTVSGGTLLINGSSGTNFVTVQSTAVLGGSGNLAGAVNVQSGGVLQGGDANLANTLTAVSVNFGTAANSVTYSRFKVAAGGMVNAGALNVTGTNVVQILDPSLTVGTNTLFTYSGSIGGTSGFGGFQLGSLPAGVTAQLLNTGSAVQLAVTSILTVNTNPPVMTNTVSSNTLTLSWPADHLGWRLEVQTNSLNNGLSNTWFTWPNSTNVTSVPITLNPNAPTVFFRLIYP